MIDENAKSQVDIYLETTTLILTLFSSFSLSKVHTNLALHSLMQGIDNGVNG